MVILRSAVAYDFVPTDVEWQTWPGYCQAKYAWTNIGSRSRYVNAVGAIQKNELARWENAGIYAVHHFCAGKTWLERAKAEASPDRRSWMLEQAAGETEFTAARSNRNAKEFTAVVLLQATILFEQSELQEAIDLLRKRIAEDPRDEVLYSATAVMQRKLGRLNVARTTLLEGYDATDGESAEINYNLGLVSLELGYIEDAKLYAKRAYELGYPLPGLRAKLARLD